jgi:hypothetical protein
VLLAVVAIAGGCASGKGTTSGKAESTGWTESTAKSEPTGQVEAAGMTGATGTTGNAETSGKTEDSGKSVAPAASKRDSAHEWIGRTFASVVDATDKAFGEERVEDRERIVRAKVGLRVEVKENEDTKYKVPANFRIPLPALERKANIFIDLTGDPDSGNVTSGTGVTNDEGSSLSATLLKRLTDTVDLGASLSWKSGANIGPEVFARYDKNWDPWRFFAEQRGFWRTDDGWGGRTKFHFDYVLPDDASYIRWANEANYYEDLYDVGFKSGLAYRRKFFWDIAMSVEAGVDWNPYDGDPKKSHYDDPEDIDPDKDHYYGRVRLIGRGWKPWVEWEILPGYYYRYEQEDPGRWGIDVRLSFLYESYLRGPK